LPRTKKIAVNPLCAIICYLLKTINLYTGGHRGPGLHLPKNEPHFIARSSEARAQLEAINLVKAFSRLVIGIAILTLLLPIYGSLLDHHLVERWPDHAHFYLGSAALDHVHPYEVPHNHGIGSNFSPHDLPPDDIVYFSSQEAAAQGFSLLTTLLIHAALTSSYSGNNENRFGCVEGHICFAQSAFIPSPKKPPRV
jgi:hypothetical protein